MMPRPTTEELAAARAEVQRFLATNPNHDLAPMMRTLLRATAPFTREEVIPVLVANTNEAGDWPSDVDDEQRAQSALDNNAADRWGISIRAQWATLVHFFGGRA